MQYARRFDVEKLKRWLYDANGGELSRKRINLRLASAEDSEKLTGYRTGGVTPFALATPELPIVLSHRIAALRPPLFWVGAGDVDLKVRKQGAKRFCTARMLRAHPCCVVPPTPPKLCVRLCDFVQRIAPEVVDVTGE